MLYRLLDHPTLDRADLTSLERVLYGAAPMRPDRLTEAIERLGPIFVQFYGQTEVPNLISTLGRDEHAQAVEGEPTRLRSAGRPCKQVDVRIVDPKTGDERPPGEPGEVVVKAPYAFEGYHERPHKTAATRRDGWVHTGDVGLLEDGYLYLLDRLDDVIVSGGLNVYAGEVEAAVGGHPSVRDVVVVGVPDDDWGEAVHAVLVTNDADLTAESVREFVADELAAYKKPKSVSFVEELPKTTLGKLDRAALRERYWRDEDRRVG
jgi:fatty-acyl-CoA synthase/long-chain acyl-CoA synthetase